MPTKPLGRTLFPQRKMFPLRLLLRQSPLNLPIVLPLSIKEKFHFPLNSTANSRYVLTYGHVATLSLPISEAMGNGPGGGRKAGGGRSWGIPSPSCLGPRNHWYLLTCQEHLLLAPPQCHLLPGPPKLHSFSSPRRWPRLLTDMALVPQCTPESPLPRLHPHHYK